MGGGYVVWGLSIDYYYVGGYVMVFWAEVLSYLGSIANCLNII